MFENSDSLNHGDEPDDGDDDDWFFNSFKRYNELQMFDFPSVVQGMELTSTNNLCVSLDESGKGRNEIMIFALPPALHTNNSIDELKLDRHLALDHGYFTSSRLQQTKCVPNEEKLFISEDAGVALYDISCSESDIIKKLADVPCNLPGSRLAVDGVNRLLACSKADNNLKVVVNYESMNTVLSIVDDDERTSAKNLVLPLFSSSNIISFGDTISGQITSYDVRDGKHVNSVNVSGGSPAHWHFNTLFDISRAATDSHEIFLFSTTGDFLVYDIRESSCPVARAKHTLGCTNSSAVQMDVCPTNTKRFSVCGFDKNVYVCELNENKVDVLFTHDGHSYNADEFEPNVLTVCSLWLPFVTENTIVSCGDNSSVQCWQFKISSV